jgi:hypothetical protein
MSRSLVLLRLVLICLIGFSSSGLNAADLDSDLLFIAQKSLCELHLTRKLVTDGAVAESDRHDYAVTPLSREEGLASIVRAAKTAEHEHSWAFIPSHDLWFDITWETEEAVVYEDETLLELLWQIYGSVEIYHSHPTPVLRRIYRSRPQVSFDPTIAGSLPSSTDLKTLWSRVKARRDQQHREGVVTEQGVTYALPTPELRALPEQGLEFFDVKNRLFQLVLPPRRSPRDHIAYLAGEQEKANVIPGGHAFHLRFFSPNEFHRIGAWLSGF